MGRKLAISLQKRGAPRWTHGGSPPGRRGSRLGCSRTPLQGAGQAFSRHSEGHHQEGAGRHPSRWERILPTLPCGNHCGGHSRRRPDGSATPSVPCVDTSPPVQARGGLRPRRAGRRGVVRSDLPRPRRRLHAGHRHGLHRARLLDTGSTVPPAPPPTARPARAAELSGPDGRARAPATGAGSARSVIRRRSLTGDSARTVAVHGRGQLGHDRQARVPSPSGGSAPGRPDRSARTPAPGRRGRCRARRRRP